MSQVRILPGALAYLQASGFFGASAEVPDGRRPVLSPHPVRTSCVHAVRDGVQLVAEQGPDRSSVMAAEACPSIDCTPLMEAPEAMASDAAV